MEIECYLTFRPKTEILLRNSKLALGVDMGIWDREKVLGQNSRYYPKSWHLRTTVLEVLRTGI